MMWVIEILSDEDKGPFMVNTMAADNLATQGARASAAMVLTYFSWYIWLRHQKDKMASGYFQKINCNFLKMYCKISNIRWQ